MAISDRHLWALFGVGAFFAWKGIQHAMKLHLSLTAIDTLPDGEEMRSDSAIPESQAEDASISGISLSALSALTKHPNPQISWAAQTVIVDRVLSDPLILDAIRSDAMQIHDAEKRRRAERALGFLNEWDEMQVWAGYENDSAEVEVEAGGHHRNHREETPLTAREMREMMADLGRHRGGVTSLEEELGEEGHEGNVELMGVGNLVGLEGNVGAREERRARREAMVIEGRDDDGEAEDGEQRGWWVVR